MRLLLVVLALVAATPLCADSIALIGVDSAPVVATLDAKLSDCAGNPGGADWLARSAGKAGRTLFVEGGLITKTRNSGKTTRRLNDRERGALRPIFGDLVDAVELTWNAVLLDEWKILFATFRFDDKSGQTFGRQIYIVHPDPGPSMPRERLKLLIHEMAHSYQYIQLDGSLMKFGDRYIRGWWQAGRSDHDNWMEVQARCIADKEIDQAWARYSAAR